MGTTLSYWHRLRRDVMLVGKSIGLMRRAGRFDRFPSYENLLISIWYDYAFYRLVLPERTVYQFLDRRVLEWKEKIANPRRKVRIRRLVGHLLAALESERIRLMFIDYLQSPSAENYQHVLDATLSTWRERRGDGIGADGLETRGGVEKGEDEKEENGQENRQEGEEEDGEADAVVLNAKAYIIAVELYFEVEGKKGEFESFSRRLPELKAFIQEKFGVEKLPGRLEEFKGYSYKTVLKDKNSARKGQLRRPFRQIMEHPEIFGERIAGKAREILEENFS